MKNLVIHKEQIVLLKDSAYNEVLSVCARFCKNDKSLMSKLKEIKMKYSEGGSDWES